MGTRFCPKRFGLVGNQSGVFGEPHEGDASSVVV